MGPSPSSKKRAELIREISKDLSRSAARRKTSLSIHGSSASASASASASENNNVDTDTGISFDPENEVIRMSTKQFDSNNTNASQGDEHFQPSASELKVDSLEFEQERILGRSPQADGFSDEGSDESVSIEIGRGGGGGGGRRSVNSTPSLLKQRNNHLDKGLGDDSFYNMIGYGNRKSRKTSDQTQNKDNQRNNRASLPISLPQKESVNKTSNYQNSLQRRTNLADMHAKASTQDGFKIDERPPTTVLPIKNTRFGFSKLRQVSNNTDAADKQQASGKSAQVGSSAALTTPQKRVKSAVAQGTQQPGNTVTQQSFMLPDLPDLTELVSGTRRDGTPIFSRNKSTKARSRFFTTVTATAVDQPRANQQDHIPVDRVPVPADEKAIFASLQLLKEKVSELELYKTEANRRIEEYERDNIELRAELSTRERLSRNEPAARNVDEEGGKSRLNWRTDKMRLESSVQSLQNRLDRAERKVSVSAIENKRMEKERDNLATQLGAAYYNHEDMRRENEALQLENETLRDEVDTLRFERERSQKETKYLRDEIMNMRVKFDEQMKHWTRRETALRREKGKSALRDEESDDTSCPDDASDQAEAYRDTEIGRWKNKEAKLRSKIEQQNDTIKLLQRSTEEKANRYLREEIRKLRTQLDQHNAERQDWSQKVNFRETDLRRELNQAIIEHQEEADKWAEKEEQLKGKISKREEAVKQLQHPAAENALDHMSRQKLAQKASRTASAGLRDKSKTGDNGKSSRPSQPKSNGAFNGSTARQQGSAVEASRKQSGRSFSHNDVSFKAAPYHVDDADDVSERNSTTDLEISRPFWHDRENSSGKPNTSQSKNRNNTDVTLLSFMDSLDVAKLRKMLEEERAASRRKPMGDAEPEALDRDNLDAPTGAFRQPALKNRKGLGNNAPTKHSVTTATARHRKGASINAVNNNAAEKSAKTDNIQQDTSHSILSNTSRRRRSAPTEMTSAFTIPDITGHTKTPTAAAVPLLANQPEIPHESKDCTICRPDAPIPDAVPVSEHPLPTSTNIDDSAAAAAIDTTLRPAQPPLEALSYVLKIISDEVTHLKLELRTAEATYSALDPAIGQRRRKAAHARICKLLSAIEARSEMLYKLHDVLQGVKGSAGRTGITGNGNGNDGNDDDDDAAAAAAFAAAGKEAENTLASLGFDLANIEDLRRKTRKSVTIAEEAEWDDDDDDDDYSDGEIDYGVFGALNDEHEDGTTTNNNNTGNAPWEGIADDFSAPMEMVTG